MRLMSPLWRVTLTALAAAAALASPLAHAQSLQELYDAARAYDATYLAAKAQAQTAEYRVTQAEAAMRPQASFTANANGNQTDLPKLGSGDTNTLTGTLGGKLALFNRSNQVDIEKARKGLLTAGADLEAAEQDLIVRVAQAYFDVLASQDSLATTQTSKKAITEQLASAKRNFEVGTATITDTREAQARFDLSVAQEIAAENDLRTKRIALDQLVGRSGVQPKALLVPVVLPPVTPGNVDEWVGTADAQHPSVRKARVGLEVATLDIAKARAGDSPTVDATASVGTTRTSGSSASLTGVSKTANIGVTLTLPLYTGGFTQARISETLVLEEKARQDLETARRAVAQGTRTAFFGVQSLQAQVKALEAAESSSKLALEATQLGYKVGVRVNLDVLNAQTLLFQTQRDLFKARYDVLVNSLKLRQAAGGLNLGDVAGVNALLAK